jgi:hypothetical protein
LIDYGQALIDCLTHTVSSVADEHALATEYCHVSDELFDRRGIDLSEAFDSHFTNEYSDDYPLELLTSQSAVSDLSDTTYDLSYGYNG